MSQLPPPLAPWSAYLDLFPHDLALALGPLVRRLAAGIGSARADARQPGDDPDGYDGLDRRGDFERLLLSEWLLADELGEEFLRRASAGELAFLKPRRRAPATPRTTVALIDAGPDQLGTSRLAHLAALIVLARRAESAGWSLLWAPLGAPDAPLLPGLDTASIGALLAARTVRRATSERLAAWRARLPATDEIWLVGGESAVALPEARALATLAVREIDDDCLEARIDRGAPIRLELPPPDVCVRLLREPFRLHQGSRRPTEAGVSRLVFAPGGRKLWTRSADGRTLLTLTVPRSRREPIPAPKRDIGHTGETVLAADSLRGGRFVLFLRRDAVRFAHIGRRMYAPTEGLYTPEPALLEILTRAARLGLRRCIVPGALDSANLWLEGEDDWLRLAADPETRALTRVETAAPFFAQRQADANTLAHFHRHDGRMRFDHSALRLGSGEAFDEPIDGVLFGYDPSEFVYATHSAGVWRVSPHRGEPRVEVAPGDEVVGVMGALRDQGESAMLVTVSAARRIVRLTSPTHRHTLPGLGGRIVQATVSNDTALLAAELDTGELVFYDFYGDEIRARTPLVTPKADAPAHGRDPALGLPYVATAKEILERTLAEGQSATLLALQPHRDGKPALAPAELRTAADDLRAAFRHLGVLCRADDGLLLLLPGKRNTAATGPIQSHGLVRRPDDGALHYAIGIVEAHSDAAESLARVSQIRDNALAAGGNGFLVGEDAP